MHQWKNEKLPAESDRLRRIAKVDKDAWSNAWLLLKPFFDSSQGFPVQLRLEKIREEWKSKQLKAQGKAKAAADARWHKDAPSNPQAIQQTSPSSSSSSSSEQKQNVNPTEGDEKLDIGNKRKQSVPLPARQTLLEAGLKLEDYESYMAVRKSKKQAFVDENARDKWITKWKGFYDEGLDTAKMFDLMISSGWIGPVKDLWTKRKREVHVMTQRELDEQNYKDFGTPPPEEWAPPDKPQGWVPCRN